MSQINAGGLPLIAIVGPTGTGKSRLATDLARRFNGEIINGDSRQVYRKMDIGTAKPTALAMSSVPHHLFNIMNPDQDFSLAEYQNLALKCIHDIHSRKRLPFLVGGTGQYVWAVIEGWAIPKVPPDWAYRKQLEKTAADGGAEELYRKLEKLDSAAAQKIDRRNVRRVIRALEVCHHSSQPFSGQKQKSAPGFKTLVLGLTTDRESLYLRVDGRVDEMMEDGFAAEVQNLIAAGFQEQLPSMSSIGYRQIAKALRQELPLPVAVNQIKMETHRFVRHQYAWFRLKDRRISWFDIKRDPTLEIMGLADEFLQR